MEIISTELYPRHTPKDPLPKTRTVTVVGQVLQLNENNRTVVIQTELERQNHIRVMIPQSMECAELRNVKFIEVRGYSESEDSMILKEYCNLKDNFDLKTYNQVIRLTEDSQFRHMFGKEN